MPQTIMICQFSIAGKPRTKKTSNRITKFKSKDGREFTKIQPSKAFVEWQKEAVKQAMLIRGALTRSGVRLPITCPIAVKALVFRAQYSGDLTGFIQAIGDALQEPKYKPDPKKNNIPKQVRAGMGIIADDAQIKSWDGSRLLKDSVRPRVDIEITEFTEDPIQTGMFDEAELAKQAEDDF